VANILREAGFDPGPKRGEGTWSDFVQRHAKTLWACDFLTVRSATIRGFVDLYVLFFVHIGSRRAFVAGVSANPTHEWVTQQARNASMQMAEWSYGAERILIDYDKKFPRSFDAVFKAEGVKVQRVGPAAPNLNAYAERFAQSLRAECLDQFVICGEGHLRHLLKEYLEHYNTERPHQAKGNVPLAEADREEPSVVHFPPVPTGEVRCRERLGGVLRHYHRDAA
jgi:putative transposase